MIRSLIYSLTFHSVMILLTVLSLPFMLREPVELPPIVSVELIQISDKTMIPYAPKARKIIEDTKKKEEEKRVVSEQAPPSAKAKEKPDRIPLPNEKKEEKTWKWHGHGSNVQHFTRVTLQCTPPYYQTSHFSINIKHSCPLPAGNGHSLNTPPLCLCCQC